MRAGEGKSYPPPVPGRIAVVGVCAAGKSVLVCALRSLGYDARQCAQEHSFVPDMWRRLARPEVLVYLDASLDAVRKRRSIDYGNAYLEEQCRRLEHARRHCDIYVQTDGLSESEVLRRVLDALSRLGWSSRLQEHD